MRKIVTRDNCIGSFVDLIFGVFSILIFNYSFLLHKFIRLKRIERLSSEREITIGNT